MKKAMLISGFLSGALAAAPLFASASWGQAALPNVQMSAMLDLEDYFCAYPEMTVSGGKGAEIRWTWAESLRDAKKKKGNRNAFVGKMYAGWSSWKDVAVAKDEANDGSHTTTVTGVSADGRLGVELAYTTYPGLALVRKTLAVVNKGEKDIAIEDVDVETFRLATLGCTNSRVMRRFARYREEGATYFGDWNDPLVVVHNYHKRCGIAVGNEGVSTMKRTTVFQGGEWLVSGTPHVGERYPFRKWLKPGERWTAMPVFTAPYSKCPDPSRVVEGSVSDYVRKYMDVRVERIPKKPMFVYNTWVPFQLKIDAKLIRELADAAAECGIEEFVIDDGWQINVSDGKYGRGDWAVDEKKFPGGLKPVFDYIKSKGMRPGLWLSLAWADPASAPMKEHPEWFVKDKAGNLSNLHTQNGDTRTACMATPWREYIRDKILGPIMLGDPRKLSADERAEYREWASWLKALEARHSFMSFRQDLPGFGEPQEGAWDGFARINMETKSGGLVGVFRCNAAERSRRVAVRGLEPDVKYAVLKGAKGERVAETTGAELMAKGFPVTLPVEIDGELFEVRRCDP